MKKTVIITALIILASLTMSSCALSKAIYLGSDGFLSRAAIPLYGNIYNTENINGNFPEAIYIKTRTQTFNSYHYYILNDGLIWYKSIDPENEPKDWILFMETGLPHTRGRRFLNPSAIAEISADADELVALSVEGNLYSYCFDNTLALRSGRWLDKQGWPVSDYFYFDERTSKNRSWALGKRNSHVLYYEDIFGNQHHNGTMEIATFYVLLEDGQEICYGDPGLPSDFSRNFIGPERGAFIAEALSVSASTIFVTNEAGVMYTRLADFDTTGCDPMFFKYTYIPYASALSGTNYRSNLNEWGLPSEDWRLQPRIPLNGEAAITRHITILQNGQGNGARELRVAGLDTEGRTGYWSKLIFDDSWKFIAVPLNFAENSIIRTAASNDDNTGTQGLSLDKSYTGFQWTGYETENGWEYEIPNFNILEGDCDFIIYFNGETCILTLHPIEMWTYIKRDYLPGRTGSPKMFLVTLVIPDNALESLSHEFIYFLNDKFGNNNKKLFHYTLAASDTYIIMREMGNTDSLWFLTDGTISNQYPEFHVGRYVENYAEVQRYFSPELSINNIEVITLVELNQIISLNRQFVDELKSQLRHMKWSQLTAFKFNAGYLPAHYIARMSPLRFVDVPKIRTITSYGDKLVLANNAYIHTITDARIHLHERMIEMVEARILCYNDIARYLSRSTIETANPHSIIPSWYSDNISDYWDIAGLPRIITGTFNYQERGNRSVEIPAVLSFIPPETEQNISGWFLAIEDSNYFSLFVEPHNAAKTIYSRNGRTPQERRLQLDCTLYINESAIAPIEQVIISRCLESYIRGENKSINVRISFDGQTFEIREYPARNSNPLIFRGIL